MNKKDAIIYALAAIAQEGWRHKAIYILCEELRKLDENEKND